MHPWDESTHSSSRSLVLTTETHQNTILALVLSSSAPQIVAVGTTAFLDCPVPTYGVGDNSSSLILHTKDSLYTASKILQTELQGGPLLMAYFDLSQILWEEWSASPPKHLKIEDKLQLTQHLLPLAVDRQWERESVPYLAATTTIRKQYRQYNGLSKVVNDTSDQWSDEEVLERQRHWLDFHRKAGFQHFYIVDNAPPSQANLQIPDSDVTYIRAAHVPYEMWRCYSDAHTTPRRWFTVAGQLMLENAIIRMVRAEWLWVGDLDEFVVVSDQYQRNVPTLLRQAQHCTGEKEIICKPETSSIFCFHILPQVMNSTTNQRLFEVSYRYKAILQPRRTATLSVHYALPYDSNQYVSSTIPPREAWLAHYNKRGSSSGKMNWTWLLETVHNHTQDLRDAERGNSSRTAVNNKLLQK